MSRRILNGIFGRVKASYYRPSRRKTDSSHSRPQSRVTEAQLLMDPTCCALDGSLLIDRCAALVSGCLLRADALVARSAELAGGVK